MAQDITFAGEKLFATQAQLNQALDIDTFIFANVPGQDPTAAIDRNEGLPPVAQRVHTQAIQQKGKINDNIVVYSTVLESITGPFEFNWVGLYSSVHQTLIAVQHIPTVNKTTTVGGAAGNALNRNFGIEYSGIAALTEITVDAQTWQLDFSARLAGMDKLTQQLAKDMNGRDWFIDDGFEVYPRATLNTFGVRAGAAYVSGLRVELENEPVLIADSYPKNVYVDAWFDGDASSTWQTMHEISITSNEINDYVDGNGKQHYVLKIAVINGADEIQDLREQESIAKKQFVLDKLVKTPSISFIFDDGKENHLNVAALFESKGFRAGFAINAPTYVGIAGRLNNGDIKKLYDTGHEIMNHSATHLSMSQNVVDATIVKAEINTCIDTLNSLGVPIFGWVSPYSTFHRDYIHFLSERHAYAFTKYDADGGEINVNDNPMTLTRFNIDDGDLERFKIKLDAIIKEKSNLCVYAHDVLDTKDITPSKLEAMLNYCKQKVDVGELEVLTTCEQIKTVIGSSSSGFLTVGETISAGSNGWVATGGIAEISIINDDSFSAQTNEITSIISDFNFDSDETFHEEQPVSFSASISSNGAFSLGMHFYDSQGLIISGESFETNDLITDTKKRRYSITRVTPLNTARVRSYIRLQANTSIAVHKPRLKIGIDSSYFGRLNKKEITNNVFNVQRQKILLIAQTWQKNNIANKIELGPFTDINEYYAIENGYRFRAKKNLQISINLYGLFSALDTTASGFGQILIAHSAANPSRYAAGIIDMRSGIGGFINQSTTINISSGDSFEMIAMHNCDNNIEIAGGDAKVALDLLVLSVF